MNKALAVCLAAMFAGGCGSTGGRAGGGNSSLPDSTAHFQLVEITSEKYNVPGESAPIQNTSVDYHNELGDVFDERENHFECLNGIAHVVKTDGHTSCALCELPAFSPPRIDAGGAENAVLLATVNMSSKAFASPLTVTLDPRVGPTRALPIAGWQGGEAVDLLGTFAPDPVTLVDGGPLVLPPVSVPAPRYLVFTGGLPRSGDTANGSESFALSWMSPGGQPDTNERVRIRMTAVQPGSPNSASGAVGFVCSFPAMDGEATVPATIMSQVPKGPVTVSVESTAVGVVKRTLGSAASPQDYFVIYRLGSTVQDSNGAALSTLTLQ